MVDTGQIRYLVNCGEGTQRIVTEYCSKVSRIQHVFLTQMSWNHVSGLLGLALTLRAAGVKTVTIHGPPEAETLMQLTRHFADSETTDIVSSEIIQKPFIDNAFHIHAFQITAPLAHEVEPASKRIKNEPNTESTVYAYYFQPFRSRRKLEKAKCVAMGVPLSILESPVVRTLIDGKDLTLPNGRVLTPEETTSPALPPKNFLILDCPSFDFLDAFLCNEELFATLRKTEYANKALLPGLSLVVHFIPEGMFTSTKYQEFVQKLEKSVQASSELTNTPELVQHLVIDGTGCSPPGVGLYSQNVLLHHFFDAQAHPLLYDLHDPHMITARNKLKTEPLSPFATVVYAESQLKYHIRPHEGFIKPAYPDLDQTKLIGDAFDPTYMSREEAESEIDKMRTTIRTVFNRTSGSNLNMDHTSGCEDPLSQTTNLSSPNTNPLSVGGHRLSEDDYPEITFLGTGSSNPNKYRNISGILLRLNPHDYIMLDCGEGTLNQLYLLYGPEKTDEILKNLRLVLISHMHADHHGGLFSICLARAKLLESTSPDYLLPILGPPYFIRWLTVSNELFSHGFPIDLNVVTDIYTPPEMGTSVSPRWQPKIISDKSVYWFKLLNSLKLKISPVKVPHTAASWAYIIECLRWNKYVSASGQTSTFESTHFEDIWSLAYSGDTPYCANLIKAGQNCDLLIHEATMLDQHSELAVRNKHSTVGDAIRAGKEMHASFTLLNHFSQRYGRLPGLHTFHPDVGTAFDFMQVRFRDLHRLAYYVPYYQYIFAKHWAQQQNALKDYAWRKFRESNGQIPPPESQDNRDLKSALNPQ